MLKRFFTVTVLSALLLSILAFTICVQRSSGATTIVVPDDFPTIQEAINNANDGNTVFVKTGAYHENVVVNRSISLIGEDAETTIIRAGNTSSEGVSSGIELISENVVIRGFTVQGCKWGTWIKSSGCLVSNNNYYDNEFEGVFLDGRDASVSENIITQNHMRHNSDCGILIWNSYNNIILSNTVEDNWVGVFLYMNAALNLVKRNYIVNNQDAGVVLDLDCLNNTLISNDISDNGWRGMPEIWKCGIALNLNCLENKIIGNSICRNKIGVFQNIVSNNNVVYHNSFIDNAEQVHPETCTNIWDGGYPMGGNYWCDYVGFDAYHGLYQNLTGSDGLGDTPYVVNANNIDNYPLMGPYVPIAGDINEDGKVNMTDIPTAARAFGATPGHPRWTAEIDLNDDNKIDLRDIASIARSFGQGSA